MNATAPGGPTQADVSLDPVVWWSSQPGASATKPRIAPAASTAASSSAGDSTRSGTPSPFMSKTARSTSEAGFASAAERCRYPSATKVGSGSVANPAPSFQYTAHGPPPAATTRSTRPSASRSIRSFAVRAGMDCRRCFSGAGHAIGAPKPHVAGPVQTPGYTAHAPSPRASTQSGRPSPVRSSVSSWNFATSPFVVRCIESTQAGSVALTSHAIGVAANPPPARPGYTFQALDEFVSTRSRRPSPFMSITLRVTLRPSAQSRK